jgi:hypothetical protein
VIYPGPQDFSQDDGSETGLIGHLSRIFARLFMAGSCSRLIAAAAEVEQMTRTVAGRCIVGLD